MVILIDSNEGRKGGRPLEFPFLCVDGIEKMKLSCGDYGVRFNDGYRPPIYFERKSISDLFMTMGVGSKRFKKEIIRSQEQNITLIIIIEGTLSKVMKGSEYSKMEGLTVIRKLFTLFVRYGIRPVFTKSREEMSLYIYNMFYALGVQHVRKK